MYKKLLALMLALCMSMVFMAGCDPEGNIVADPIVGSDVPGYERMVLDYLESAEN